MTRGYTVTIISRTPGPGRITWDDVESKGIPDVDVVIQVPGANIMDKAWTPERKKELLDSRVGTTAKLVKAMEQSAAPPKVFVSGSAVGIYPTSETEEFDETSTKVADNFAGELVRKWEEASQLPPALQDKTRRVVIRTGAVLASKEGMLQKMLTPFKLGLGGPFGSGNQYLPWIHIEDLVSLGEHAINKDNISGVLNGVAPDIVTNAQFAQELGRALHRPAIIPMPAFVIRFMFGERALLLLEGQKVIPKRTIASGFTWEYPTLKSALAEATGNL
jgi:uncharacterized protein (TIGR01777 family)